jgi:nucleoid-associated protein Lsr2
MAHLDFAAETWIIPAMAQKVNVLLVDDLDGESAADETVRFGLDGRDLELDLSAENATEMRETLRKYVDAARKTGSSKTGRASARRTVTDVDPKAVRAWAAANGREVSSRGRIPAEVVEAYRAAGN